MRDFDMHDRGHGRGFGRHRMGKGLVIGAVIFIVLGLLVMTLWSLLISVQTHLGRVRTGTAAAVHHVEFSVVVLLSAMAVWLVVEAFLLARQRPPAAPLVPEPRAA